MELIITIHILLRDGKTLVIIQRVGSLGFIYLILLTCVFEKCYVIYCYNSIPGG